MRRRSWIPAGVIALLSAPGAQGCVVTIDVPGTRVPAPIVFAGTATTVLQVGAGGLTQRVDLRVDTVLAGAPRSTATVTTFTQCGPSFTTGRRYLVFASPRPHGPLDAVGTWPTREIAADTPLSVRDLAHPPPPGFIRRAGDLSPWGLVHRRGPRVWWLGASSPVDGGHLRRITVNRGVVAVAYGGGLVVRTGPRRGPVPAAAGARLRGIPTLVQAHRVLAFTGTRRIVVSNPHLRGAALRAVITHLQQANSATQWRPARLPPPGPPGATP